MLALACLSLLVVNKTIGEAVQTYPIVCGPHGQYLNGMSWNFSVINPPTVELYKVWPSLNAKTRVPSWSSHCLVVGQEYELRLYFPDLGYIPYEWTYGAGAAGVSIWTPARGFLTQVLPPPASYETWQDLSENWPYPTGTQDRSWGVNYRIKIIDQGAGQFTIMAYMSYQFMDPFYWHHTYTTIYKMLNSN